MWLIYSTTISSLMLPQRLGNEPEKERTSQVALEEKHKILCHGKHLTSVLQCPGWAARNGFWVCFSSSQQGSNIILLVVSSSEVFLLPCSVTWHYCYIVAQHVPCSLFNCFDPVNRHDWGKHTGRKEGKVERWKGQWQGDHIPERKSVSVPVCSVAAVLCCFCLIHIKTRWLCAVVAIQLLVIENTLIVVQSIPYDEWRWAKRADETNSTP